jgi:hypothetical protein
VNTMDRTATVPLGRLLATPGALAAFSTAREMPLPYLARHAGGDWGEVDQEDWAANDRAMREGTRLLSAYHLSDGTKVWIITEADRSVTTVLLPDEY